MVLNCRSCLWTARHRTLLAALLGSGCAGVKAPDAAANDTAANDTAADDTGARDSADSATGACDALADPLPLDDLDVLRVVMHTWYPRVVSVTADLGIARDSSAVIGCPTVMEDTASNTTTFKTPGFGCINLGQRFSFGVRTISSPPENVNVEQATQGAYRIHPRRLPTSELDPYQSVGFRGALWWYWAEPDYQMEAHFAYEWHHDGMYGSTPYHGSWRYDGTDSRVAGAAETQMHTSLASDELRVSGDVCVTVSVVPVPECPEEGVGHYTIIGANVVDVAWDGTTSCDGCGDLTIDGAPVEGCWNEYGED